MKRLLLPLLLLLLLFGCAKSFPESTDILSKNPDLSAIPTDQADPSSAARFRFDSQMLRVAAYGRYDLIPVVLVEQ